MFNLFQKVNLLKHFPLRKIVLHVVLFDGFDSHLFASKLVNPQSNFAESPLADHLYELVKIESSGRKFVVLLDVLFHVLNQLISLLDDCVVDSSRWFLIPVAAALC